MMCGGTTSVSLNLFIGIMKVFLTITNIYYKSLQEFFTFLIPVNFINWIKQLNANFDTGFPVNGLTLTPDSPVYF